MRTGWLNGAFFFFKKMIFVAVRAAIVYLSSGFYVAVRGMSVSKP